MDPPYGAPGLFLAALSDLCELQPWEVHDICYDISWSIVILIDINSSLIYDN